MNLFLVVHRRLFYCLESGHVRSHDGHLRETKLHRSTDASKFIKSTPSGPSSPVHHDTFLRALLTCSSVPSAVTMVTEWAPCVASSWAGMVMVVPSWVTMVIVPPIACKSASEILTWGENGVFSVRGNHSATARADLHYPEIFYTLGVFHNPKQHSDDHCTAQKVIMLAIMFN